MLRDAGGFVRQKPFLMLMVAGLGVTLSGCGTTPAKEFGGRWKPVNHFTDQPQELPLHAAYVYQASPMDRTLKTMLERWAADSGYRLDYRLQSDYTLHQQVAQVSATDLQQAAAAVAQAYAAQGVLVRVDGNALIAEPALAAG